MSSNPATNDSVDTSTIPEAPAGGTVSGDSTEAVKNSSYDSNSAAKLVGSSKSLAFSGIQGFNNATTFTDQSLAVFASTRQGVILKDKAGATWGTKSNGKPDKIGGAVVDASKAKKVIVTLSDNKVDNASSKKAASRFIPDDVKDSIKAGKFNTISVLSKGADNYLGTTSKDFASLGKGKDRAFMGKGKDLVAMSDNLSTKRITLGKGKDRALLEEGALQGKGKVIIDDFNNKKDSLIIETKQSKVEGINSDTLRISTKGGTVKVTSDNDVFSKSSLEFLG